MQLDPKTLAGTFSYYSDGSRRNPVSYLYAQDLNKDGVDEVLFVAFETQLNTPDQYSNTSVHIFGWRAGTFEEVTQQWLPGNSNLVEGVGDVAFGDFNGDGLQDVFLSAYTDMAHPVNAYVLYNTGAGFHKVSMGLQTWQHSVRSYDINQDGYDDVIPTGYADMPRYMGSANGLVKFKGFTGGSGLALGDFMNNGTASVIFFDAGQGLNDTYLYNFNFSGTEYVAVQRVSQLPGPRLESIAPTASSHDIRAVPFDFNDDGFLDVIAIGYAYGANNTFPHRSEVQFLLNKGNGVFEDATTTYRLGFDVSGGVGYTPQLLDINQDGLHDLFLSMPDWMPTYNSTSLLLQQPDHTFVDTARTIWTSAIESGGGQGVLVQGPNKTMYLVTESEWHWDSSQTTVYLQKINFPERELSETLIGTRQDDTIMGLGGDDQLQGNSGNDTLDGGSGNDTAIFSGNRSQYTISSTASTWTIFGTDGVDTLNNIEFAQFSDQTIALDNTPTYGLTASSGSVNEGGSVTYTVTTTNVAANTVLNYTLSGAGITTPDLGGAALTGTTTVGSNGSATFTVNLAADQWTEGAEILIATVQSQSASVTVNDTSTNRAVASRTKYFVLPSSTGANFTDFNLSYGAVTLTGEQVTFVGSSVVDAVFVRPGVTLDFTLSGSGADKIYLGGSFANYTSSIAGSVMTLQRGSGATLESVSFIKSTSAISSDSVIFADGTLNSLDLYNNLKNAAALPALSTTETSIAPLAPALAGSVLNASIKAFALNSTGDTFAPAHPGVAMTVVGSVGVDTVYVRHGGVVDCTLLGSGQDLIYFTGNWADYTKAISGSVLTFGRTVDGYNESVKVVGSSTNISLNDHLVFGDGAVYSGDAKVALTISVTAAISAVTAYDATMTTPNTVLSQSVLNGVTNIEVGSNIVLNYSANVTAVNGKYIHIVNDGNGAAGLGFHGENIVNTLDILVTDTTQVTISSGGKVTLNPTADLDLANNYHITIDAGAFASASGGAMAAYDGTSTLHFSTVTPGTTALANAVASQVMNADGTLGNGHFWLDIEGIGSPSAMSGVAFDLSAKNYALVAKDYDVAGGSAETGYDGVRTADFYVAASNFGIDDLLYIDNQVGTVNDLLQTNIFHPVTPPMTVQFTGAGLGGLVEVTLAGTTAMFDTIAQMKTLLGASTSPVISA